MTPWPLLILLAGSAAAYADEGEYLFHAAGCLACHTAEDGQPLAGGRPLETPYGTFYSPNISPDRETGIGAWSRREFIDALKHGTAPDGGAYYPVFPYPSYRRMTDADAGKIFDYLQTRTAQSQPNREHDTPWWLFRWMMKLWQWWALDDPEPAPTDPEPRARALPGRRPRPLRRMSYPAQLARGVDSVALSGRGRPWPGGRESAEHYA